MCWHAQVTNWYSVISESIPDTGPGGSMDPINTPMEESAGIAEDEDDIDWEEGWHGLREPTFHHDYFAPVA